MAAIAGGLDSEAEYNYTASKGLCSPGAAHCQSCGARLFQ